MSEEFNVYDHKQQLPHGVWVFNKGSKEWSEEMNANMEALDAVLERKTLTIKDSEDNTLVEFDGKVDKILTLPEAPEIPEVDIKKLTIKNSAGTTLVEFDGSTDKELTLPEAQVSQTQGGSFTYNTTKDYTTLYFTEEALQTLGYSGLSDSNALKYRTVIGSQPLTTSPKASPKNSFGVSDNDGNGGYSIVSPNPNLFSIFGSI